MNIYLKAVNNQGFIQSDHDTRFWYPGKAASIEYPQAPLPLLPPRTILVSLAKFFFFSACWYPVCRLCCSLQTSQVITLQQTLLPGTLLSVTRMITIMMKAVHSYTSCKNMNSYCIVETSQLKVNLPNCCRAVSVNSCESLDFLLENDSG